jgi:hypothetical protein
MEAELRRCASDFRYFVTRYVHIEDKSSRTGYVLFPPLPHQDETIDALLNERRLIVLKARQLGLTTTIMAYILWRALFQPGFSALVLSHKDDYAKANIDRMRLMYNLLPAWMRSRLPEPNQASNSFVVDFPAGLKSNVLSLPATGKVGASMTLDFVFLDEFGLMEYADQAYETLVPTIDAAMNSPRKGCVLAVASTARGSANAFARMWRGQSSMKKLFFPWSCSPNFTQDDYERERDECAAKGEPWKIFQERPASAEEAFRKSGSAYFGNLPALDEVEDFPYRGRIVEAEDGELSFLHDPRGALRLVDLEPEPGGFYALGVDPAHGVGADSTVGIVTTFDQTGTPIIAGYWSSNTVQQADAAEELDLVGRWFAGSQRAALLVPETTGGHAELMIHIWRSREYPNLYSFMSPSARKRRLAPTIGLNTAGVGGRRNLVLGRLSEYLPELGNIYPLLREEMGTFVRKEGSEFVAADIGCHDDHVLSCAISLWALVERGHAPTRDMVEKRQGATVTFSVLPEIEKQMEVVRRAQQDENRRWQRQLARKSRPRRVLR